MESVSIDIKEEFQMFSKLLLHLLMILCFLSLGIAFTFFPEPIREYYFRMYKNGAERVGVLTSWVDKYPGYLVFRTVGIAALIISVVLIILLIKRLQN